MRKDQTTSTGDGDVFAVSPVASAHLRTGPTRSFAERGEDRHNADVTADPDAVAIGVHGNDPGPNTDPSRPTCPDDLFFYNQPVAVFHAPAFFHLEGRPEQHHAPSRDGVEPALSDGPSAAENEDQLGVLEGSRAATSTDAPGGRSGLTESASVPGTLSKISGGGRRSLRALADLSKVPSAPPPRAWFVSLEGKPAAEIHYAVSEQQRRRRPVESRETSLDSGVDMSELNPAAGRRAVTLERNATFVKSIKHAPPQ
ncbi:Protein FAM171B [Liparis tanakae]|uniref:Protein FAM171B n=1 Tax=Liparis tanakae TaxID=230148 RepID=A0A4Z2H7H2_9TELE|nr:Protein FAM171B [Liparis tanakae]